MKIGLLTRNPQAWCSARLLEAIRRSGAEPFPFSFKDIVARVGSRPQVSIADAFEACEELDGILVRPIGRGSVDEIIFRLDVLHRLERGGVKVVNMPSAIEKAVDKYYALSLLEDEGVQIPPTVVTEDGDSALDAFDKLGGDVVVKPLFGSRGMGVTRVSDREVARRIFYALNYSRNVVYIQKFIPHGKKDIRAFVVGDSVIAAMHRRASGWKTNVSMGAKPVSIKPTGELEDIAVKAAKILGCEIAGVDVIENREGMFVNEINSQPGFRGLQSVSQVNIADKIIEHVIKISQ